MQADGAWYPNGLISPFFFLAAIKIASGHKTHMSKKNFGLGAVYSPRTNAATGRHWAPPVISKTVGLGSATGRHQP